MFYTCTKCGGVKLPTEFTGWPRNKWCKACNSAYQRALRKQGYRANGRNKALAALPTEDRHLWHIMQCRRASVMQRIGRGVPGQAPEIATLVALWHAQSGLCALSGLAMSLEENTHHVVSLDQKLPGLGYAPDNLQLVSWAVNRAKGDLSTDEFIEMCRAVGRCNDYPAREYTQVGGSA